MRKIWLKSYSSGITEMLNVETYHSLQEVLEGYCKRFKDKTAFINFGISTSYSQLDKLSRDFATYLQKHLKMKKGERFGIILPNLLQFPVAMFSALRAGLVVVNFNPLYTAREFAFQLKDVGVTGLIVLESFSQRLSLALEKCEIKHVIVTKIGDCLKWKKPVINFIVKYVNKMVSS